MASFSQQSSSSGDSQLCALCLWQRLCRVAPPEHARLERLPARCAARVGIRSEPRCAQIPAGAGHAGGPHPAAGHVRLHALRVHPLRPAATQVNLADKDSALLPKQVAASCLSIRACPALQHVTVSMGAACSCSQLVHPWLRVQSDAVGWRATPCTTRWRTSA